MSKTIKIALFCIIGLPLIILSALLSVFLFKDANDFKPDIEEQAKLRAGLNLRIEDNLSWSLIPIGLEINTLKILDQNEAPFASADKIVASIDFWSLFKGAPKVETILLDGLKLELVQTSDTDNNWSNILPPKSEVEPESSPSKAEEIQTISEPTESQRSLNFLVESFQLINTNIRFESKPNEINLNINPLNLSLTQITLGETFPLSLSYSLSETKNQINIDSTLKASLFASKDLTKFTLSNLQNSYEVNAPTISKKAINLNLASNIDIDTKAESVDISSLLISLNNLVLEGQAKIRNYNKDLSVNSDIKVPNFSLKALLESLNIALPEMQSKEALEKVSLSSNISLEKNLLQFKGMNISLDKSKWLGEVSHSMDTSASKVRIKGDKINLDDYLPPVSDTQENDVAVEEPEQAQAAQPETDQALLPIETLKALNLDIEFLQDSISIKNIETNKVLVAVIAKDGLLTQTLSGKLFDGSYSSKASINVQNKEPLWSSEQNIKDLNLAQVFKKLNIEALKEYGSIAGLLNLNATTKMSGNQMNTLKKSATSNVDFHIDKGAFEGLSLNALTCKGFALINKEVVDTSTWPQATPFNTLKGSASLKNEILDTRFDLITSGVHADSKGSIDISKNAIDILASLKVIGELGDNACRVNENVTKIGIPVKCQGAFDTPPAELCKLDTSRLGDMAKDLAIEEGKRKANKEINRALDKHLGDKKEAVKSIFNKFLK
tara:strand:+ start:751 stop:2928 length:2178 start_codon:yes stop_codon:yes gene_type:complete